MLQGAYGAALVEPIPRAGCFERRVAGMQTSSPEIVVRRVFGGMGLHGLVCPNHLLSRPEISVPAERKMIFVQRCFWHQHRAAGCRLSQRTRNGKFHTEMQKKITGLIV
jgi:G:T-mismatch repair DNA endonuclease (very short patch repair protein)